MSARRNNGKIFVLLDNQAVVIALNIGKSASSIRLTKQSHSLAKSVNAEYIWIPGHSRISGNEQADAEARTALKDLPERHIQLGLITFAYLRQLMHQKFQHLVVKWWSEACPARYQDLDLEMRRRKPSGIALPRQLINKLIATRTGHDDFVAYHRRLKHLEAILECVC